MPPGSPTGAGDGRSGNTGTDHDDVEAAFHQPLSVLLQQHGRVASGQIPIFPKPVQPFAGKTYPAPHAAR
jgi:hypothetical protein